MDQPAPVLKPSNRSSLGMSENVAAALSYLLGFITGILFFVMEKQSSFVRFHAMQSILAFGVLFVLGMVTAWIPVLGRAVTYIVGPVSFVLWLLLMWKAFQGERYKLPIFGDLAEKQVK